jgi:hypothetical protein
MARRQPEIILQGLINGRGKEAKLRRKLEVGQARNWLVALTVNAFEKLADGARLTDLDTGLLNAYRQSGYSDDELKGQGRLFKQLPLDTRRTIFPAKFAELSSNTSYTLSDLRADAPRIMESVRGLPTISDIDLEAIHAGRAHIRDFLGVSKAVRREHGSRLIVAADPSDAGPPGLYTIKALSFRCVDESSELSDSDEVYWLFGTTAQGTHFTSQTHIFNDVDVGMSYNLDAKEGNIWGPLGDGRKFPDGNMGVTISCFEHDEGSPAEIKKGFEAAFAAALVVSGIVAPGWVTAVIGALGAAISFFLGFLDEDHIADHGFVFNGQTVQNLAKGGTITFLTTFTDSDAEYRLKLQISRVA